MLSMKGFIYSMGERSECFVSASNNGIKPILHKIKIQDQKLVEIILHYYSA